MRQKKNSGDGPNFGHPRNRRHRSPYVRRRVTLVAGRSSRNTHVGQKFGRATICMGLPTPLRFNTRKPSPRGQPPAGCRAGARPSSALDPSGIAAGTVHHRARPRRIAKVAGSLKGQRCCRIHSEADQCQLEQRNALNCRPQGWQIFHSSFYPGGRQPNSCGLFAWRFFLHGALS